MHMAESSSKIDATPATAPDPERTRLRGQSRFLELFRVAGHRLVRRQALAMPRTEYPRPLTQSIARVIHSALVRG
jgi:hypothetical protein